MDCIDSVAEIFYNSMGHLVKPLGNFDAVLHFRQIISVFSAMGSDRILGSLSNCVLNRVPSVQSDQSWALANTTPIREKDLQYGFTAAGKTG